MELILVVFALFVIATPLATVYLLWRERILRQQLLKLTNLSMEISDGLRRDLLELKRQVETSAVPVPPPDAPSHFHPAVQAQADATPITAAPPAQPPLVSPARITPPIPVVDKAVDTIPDSAKKDAPPPPPKPDPTLPPVPAIFQKAEQKPEENTEPTPEQKPDQKPIPVPTIAPPVATAPPPATVAPTPVLPAHRPEPPRPSSATTPSTPIVPPPTPATPPPAARVAAPSQQAAFRASASVPSILSSPAASAPKTAEQRMKSVFALEEILGRNWLNKIGIVLIVLGVAYFGIKELGQLGPVGKVILSYVVSLCPSRRRNLSRET